MYFILGVLLMMCGIVVLWFLEKKEVNNSKFYSKFVTTAFSLIAIGGILIDYFVIKIF